MVQKYSAFESFEPQGLGVAASPCLPNGPQSLFHSKSLYCIIYLCFIEYFCFLVHHSQVLASYPPTGSMHVLLACKLSRGVTAGRRARPSHASISEVCNPTQRCWRCVEEIGRLFNATYIHVVHHCLRLNQFTGISLQLWIGSALPPGLPRILSALWSAFLQQHCPLLFTSLSISLSLSIGFFPFGIVSLKWPAATVAFTLALTWKQEFCLTSALFTGILSQIRTKLRDYAVWQAWAGATLRQHCPQMTRRHCRW